MTNTSKACRSFKARSFFMLAGVDGHIQARIEGKDFIFTHEDDLDSTCELYVSVANRPAEGGWRVAYVLQKDGAGIQQASSGIIPHESIQGVIAAIANDAFKL